MSIEIHLIKILIIYVLCYFIICDLIYKTEREKKMKYILKRSSELTEGKAKDVDTFTM